MSSTSSIVFTCKNATSAGSTHGAGINSITLTLYPHEVAPVANDTVFFVNAADWAAVKVYAWGGTAARTEWPGLDATKADYQLQSKDVYYFVAAQGAYGKCILQK